MKIICVMAIYKRPAVTLKTIELMQKQTHPLDKIIAVGSSEIDKKTAAKAGVEYVEYQNQPLSDKWQHGVYHAKQFNPDAILINGSDSWLTTNWCEVAKEYIEKGADLVGKTQFYSCRVNPNEKLFILNRRYKSRKDPVGAGRLFSKRVLDKLNWHLFPKGLVAGLDGNSYKHMLAKFKNAKVNIINDHDDVKVMGIKSTTWETINPFKFVKNSPQFTFGPDIKDPAVWVEKHFPGSIKIFKELVPEVKI